MSEGNNTNNPTGSQENQNQSNGRTSGTSTQVRDPNAGAEFHSDFATAVLRDIVNGNPTTSDNNGEGAIDVDRALRTLDPGLSIPSTVPMNLSTSSRGESSSGSGNLHVTSPENTTAGSYGLQQPLISQPPTIHQSSSSYLPRPTAPPQISVPYAHCRPSSHQQPPATQPPPVLHQQPPTQSPISSTVHQSFIPAASSCPGPSANLQPNKQTPLLSIPISRFLRLLCEWTTSF